MMNYFIPLTEQVMLKSVSCAQLYNTLFKSFPNFYHSVRKVLYLWTFGLHLDLNNLKKVISKIKPW